MSKWSQVCRKSGRPHGPRTSCNFTKRIVQRKSRKEFDQEAQSKCAPCNWYVYDHIHAIGVSHSCKQYLEGEKVSFIFGGVQVCKAFYRECTGFSKNLFHSCVWRALNGDQSKPVVQPVQTLNQSEKTALGCLDFCFGRRLIKRDPSKVLLDILYLFPFHM